MPELFQVCCCLYKKYVIGLMTSMKRLGTSHFANNCMIALIYGDRDIVVYVCHMETLENCDASYIFYVMLWEIWYTWWRSICQRAISIKQYLKCTVLVVADCNVAKSRGLYTSSTWFSFNLENDFEKHNFNYFYCLPMPDVFQLSKMLNEFASAWGEGVNADKIMREI